MSAELSRRGFMMAATGTFAAAWGAKYLEPMPAGAAVTPGSPPPLDSLKSVWLAPEDIIHTPAISNFYGGIRATRNLTGLADLTMPPYTQGPEYADRGEMCALTVDSVRLSASQTQWAPYELRRIGTTDTGLVLEAVTRLGFQANTVLMTIGVTNQTERSQTTDLELALDPSLCWVPTGWDWSIPRAEEMRPFNTTKSGSNIVVADALTAAVSVFGFAGDAAPTLSTSPGTAKWTMTVPAGTTKNLQVVLAFGRTSTDKPYSSGSAADAIMTQCRNAVSAFDATFAAAKSGWEGRWQDAFTPGNGHFSGSLPVLATSDGSISRLYYMSVLSVLACERTNFGPDFSADYTRPSNGAYTGFKRAYITAGPEYAVTAAYFWDTSYASIVLALLDPEALREFLEHTLTNIDIYQHYAVDVASGGGLGPWYSANDLTVSSTVLNYVHFSGNWAFLDKVVGSGTVLARLTTMATKWQDLRKSGQSLADYGDSSNLLEVLPQYTGQVPSLNAANVWLMETVADLHGIATTGSASTAQSLRSKAANLVIEVKKLYVAGDGVWNCRHTDGSLVPVRTVVDFAIGGNLIAGHLSPTERADMSSFVKDELILGDWLRALSLEDKQGYIQREDHGSSGAYESWPALAAQTFARFGDYSGMTDQLRTYSGVTARGPFGQGHQYGVLPRFADCDELNPTQALTVSAWVHPDSWPANIWEGNIVSKNYDSRGYVLRGGAGGRLQFAVSIAGVGWVSVETPDSTEGKVSTSGWHHVAGVYDGATLKIYIDGAEQASKAQSGVIVPSVRSDLQVGTSAYDASEKFSGSISGALVHARALAAPEVQRAFASGDSLSGNTDSGLVAWVPMDPQRVTNALADRTELNPTTALTVSAWVRPDSWPANIYEASIVAKDSWSGGDKGYVLRGGAGGRLSFAVALASGGWVEVQTPNTDAGKVPTSGWHHVAGVYDGATMKIYLDGVEQASKTQTGTLAVATGVDLKVGVSPSDAARKFTGGISGAQVHSRGLGKADLARSFATGSILGGTAHADLVGWLPPDSSVRSRTIRDREELNPTAAVTVSAWVHPDSWPTNIYEASIIAKDSWSGGDKGYVLRGGAGGRLSFAVALASGGWVEVQTPNTDAGKVSTSGWHHVAGVYDGATMKIYLDGVEQASKAQTGSLAQATGVDLKVGVSPSDATRKFRGSVSGPQIQRRAVTPAEISRSATAGDVLGGVTDPGLVAWVPMDPQRVTSALADRAELNPAAGLTVSAWVHPDSWPANIYEGSIVAKDSWSGGDKGYVLRGGAGGRVSFAVALASGGWADLQTPNADAGKVPTSGWHHVAGVYDGTTMKIYLDGVEQASKAQTGNLSRATGVDLKIGISPSDATRKFIGSISGAQVHSRALGKADLARSFAAGDLLGGTTPSARAMRTPGYLPADIGVIEQHTLSAGGLMTYNEICGGAFADVVIGDLFGAQPQKTKLGLRDESVSRAFTGKLTGFRFNQGTYSITSDASGVVAAKES